VGEDAWLMTRQDGEARSGNDYYLDPGHPAVGQYIVDAIAEITRKYDVDGVQLDRMRYPDPSAGRPDWGYNETAVARYQTETGATERPAPGDSRWVAWRRTRIDDLVRQIRDAVKAERPDAWVSVATITYGPGPRDLAAFRQTRTYAEVLQDWPSWLQSGSVDLIVTMNYKRDVVPAQAQWFDGWNTFARSVRGTGRVAAGTALYLNPVDASVRQAVRTVNSGLDGWVGYSYRAPDDRAEGNPAGAAATRQKLFTRLGAPDGPLRGRPVWGTPDEVQRAVSPR
jgi:uncharacterized lipoprotein YddW (UPF0748 family)